MTVSKSDINTNIIPKAKKQVYSYKSGKNIIKDDYNWLRDKNWPKVNNKEIIKYLNEENNYANDYLKKHNNLTNKIFEELKGRIKLTDISTYTKKDNYYYFTKTFEDKNYPIYYRKKILKESKEEVILDVNKLAENKKYTKIGAISVSPDQKLLAYSVDFEGNERYQIRVVKLKEENNDLNVKDIDISYDEHGRIILDKIDNVIGGVIWHEELNGFFFTPTTKEWRHDKVMYHELYNKNDKLIFHEKDTKFLASVSKSSSKEYIFITSSGHESSKSYFINMKDHSMKLNLISERIEKIEYEVDHGKDYFYIRSNHKERNFTLYRVKDKDYTLLESKDNWQEIIKGGKLYIQDFDLTLNYLIVNYQDYGVDYNRIYDLNNMKHKEVSFDEKSRSAHAYSTNYIEDDIRISYSSLKRPSTIYEYSYKNNKTKILKTQEIPTGFNPSDYESERLYAKSEDVLVPISIIYKKSLFKKDGTSPLYLYGYGSYGIGMDPSFRTSIISLLDRGFIFAIAHIRGGDDLGFKWYESAKYLNKKRTFIDYINSAKYLIDNNYTKKGNIVASGGSAGGMLVGNVINNASDLFKLAIAHVPFVDVLNTMLDETLPLTPGEYKEWGNPKDQEYFDYISSYCPYNNVHSQRYPNMYVTAGISDPRVGYWEAAKWVAKIRELKTDDNLILLKTNMDSGHSGLTGRFDYLKEIASEYSYILSIFDVYK